MAILLDELCSRLRSLYLPAVCDAIYELGPAEPVLPTTLRPLLDPAPRVVGEAYNVQGAGIEPLVSWDEGLPRKRSYLRMFEKLPPYTVLVSTTPLSSTVGHFGELTTNAAKSRRSLGAVVDGNLWDIEGMRDISLRVFYRSLSPLKCADRWATTALQIHITIDDVGIRRGDIVLAEAKAILITLRKDAERILLKCIRARGDRGESLG